MIIVSGPDNSGKTSLVNRLCDDMGLVRIPKFNVLPPWEHPHEYAKWIRETLSTGPVNGIVDRCFIDELVYGPVIRKRVSFSMTDWSLINGVYRTVKPLMIITDPGFDSIIDTYRNREQYPSIDQNLEVRERYYEVVSSYPFDHAPLYFFNYNFDPGYTLVKSVIDYYIRRKENEHQQL